MRPRPGHRVHAALRSPLLLLLLALCTAGLAVPGSADAAGPARAAAAAPAASQAAPRRAGQHLVVKLRVAKTLAAQRRGHAKVVVTSRAVHGGGKVVVRARGRGTVARGWVRRGRWSATTVRLRTLRAGSYRLQAVLRPGHHPRRSAWKQVRSVGGCAADPASCAFPSARNTGPSASVRLRDVPGDVRSGRGWHFDDRGWIQVDGDGAVLTGIRSRYGLNIQADDVTVSQSVLNLSSLDWGISLRTATGVTIDRNIIRGPSSTSPCDNGIRDIYGDSDRVRITRNEIYHCASAINHFNTGGRIAENYIHDLGHPCSGNDPDCGHFNGIQLGAGYGSRMTIDHNTILNPAPATDAIMLANDDGPQTNRVITDNLLAGGGYTLYGSGGPQGQATHIIVSGNRFSTRYYPRSGSFGPVAHWQDATGNTWTGNTWIDGSRKGSPVRP